MRFTIALEESVTLSGVTALREQILEALSAHEAVELDVAALGEADLSLLQLLAAARAHATAKGKTFRLAAPAGEALAALLARAGFTQGASEDDLQFWFHGAMPQ